MRFDKEAEWYPGYEHENLSFTGNGAAKADDQFDSTAIMVKGLDLTGDVEEEDFYTEEEEEFAQAVPQGKAGRSMTTGY
jgi:hypothetical protein